MSVLCACGPCTVLPASLTVTPDTGSIVSTCVGWGGEGGGGVNAMLGNS